MQPNHLGYEGSHLTSHGRHASHPEGFKLPMASFLCDSGEEEVWIPRPFQEEKEFSSISGLPLPAPMATDLDCHGRNLACRTKGF